MYTLKALIEEKKYITSLEITTIINIEKRRDTVFYMDIEYNFF